MHIKFFLPSLSSSALLILLTTTSLVSVATAGELIIEPQGGTTECTRKTVYGDKVSVEYRGTLQSDGTEFDKSANRGQPIQFVLGEGRVIKGWEQGLLDMCVGEKRKLIIPPELGYGKYNIGPIPPDSTLVFDTELVGIEGVPSKDEL